VIVRLLALASCLAVLACRQVPPPAPPAPGPDARAVTVESEPPGAEVVVDGWRRGETPCAFRLDPGQHRLTLRRSGYLPYQAELVVRFGADARVAAALVASH
jgi:hypothetical protein